MPRRQQFIDATVREEAVRRLHHIYDLHDTVAVCFSGGKDSLTVLHLTWEVAQARGLSQVDVVFRDEEFIPAQVVDFVQGYRTMPWVRMHYYCIPLESSRFVLGTVKPYVQWDEHRAHVRPMPEFAIRLREGEHRVLDQFSADDYIVERSEFAGKVAFITGIRAAESMMRYRASVNKLNDNYINASSSRRVSLCKPIFDWQENDVFRYFYEEHIDYCPVYDRQLWGAMLLRVATPMVSESAKNLHKLKGVDPVLFQQVMTAFPEMAVQERYWREYKHNAKADLERYGQSWAGIQAWIEEHIIDPAWQAKAIARLRDCRMLARTSPASYPTDHVFKYFKAGQFKKMILPVSNKERA